jgi:hypothetical protein
VEASSYGLLKLELLAKGNQGVGNDVVGIDLVFPEVNEKIVLVKC